MDLPSPQLPNASAPLVAGLQRPMLELQEVTKVYPSGKIVLTKLSLAICNGEVIVILGTSGCGKTTLLRMLAGLDKPTEGRVTTSVLRPDGKKPVVSYMPQGDSLFPWRTVHQNVTLPSEVLQEHGCLCPSDLMKSMDISDFQDKFPFELSGGMRRGVELARALLPDFNILLLDEPLVHLDVTWHDKLVKTIRQRVKQRLTDASSGPVCAVIVTHNLEEAGELADRILVLSRDTNCRGKEAGASVLIDEPVPRTVTDGVTAEFVTPEKQQIILEHLRRLPCDSQRD